MCVNTVSVSEFEAFSLSLFTTPCVYLFIIFIREAIFHILRESSLQVYNFWNWVIIFLGLGWMNSNSVQAFFLCFFWLIWLFENINKKLWFFVRAKHQKMFSGKIIFLKINFSETIFWQKSFYVKTNGALVTLTIFFKKKKMDKKSHATASLFIP